MWRNKMSFTFVWPCIVTNFFIIKPTRWTDAGPGWNCSSILVLLESCLHIPVPSVQWINYWWWTDEMSETWISAPSWFYYKETKGRWEALQRKQCGSGWTTEGFFTTRIWRSWQDSAGWLYTWQQAFRIQRILFNVRFLHNCHLQF